MLANATALKEEMKSTYRKDLVIALSNFQIEDAAPKYSLPDFKGVFMVDTIPASVKGNESFIYNFQKNSQRGSHWVAIGARDDLPYYFDSYGQEPQDNAKFTMGNNWMKTDSIVQEFDTNYCGHLALCFLHTLYNFDFLNWESIVRVLALTRMGYDDLNVPSEVLTSPEYKRQKIEAPCLFARKMYLQNLRV